MVWLDGKGAREAFLLALPLLARPRISEREIGGKAAVVGEQLANGDVLLAVGGEVGKVLGDGIVGTEFALLVELHDGGRGHEGLGERRHVEDGVEGHGLLRGFKRARTVAMAIDDLAVVANDENRAGDLMFFDGCIEETVFGGEVGLSWNLRGSRV